MPSNPRSMRSGPDGTSRPEAVTGRPAGAAATPNRPRGVLVFAANGSAYGARIVVPTRQSAFGLRTRCRPDPLPLCGMALSAGTARAVLASDRLALQRRGREAVQRFAFGWRSSLTG